MEKIVKEFTAPCSTFKGVYPFVERRFVKGKMEEKLMLGDKMIHTKIVDEPEDCWTPIYSFFSGYMNLLKMCFQ
jgi:hypothetical protein